MIAGAEGVRFDPTGGDAVSLLDFTLAVSMPTVICEVTATNLDFYIKNNLAWPMELKYAARGVFKVDQAVFDTLDDAYIGLNMLPIFWGASGDGALVYQGKYHDYNVGYVVCLTASTTIGKRNWRERKPGC